MDTEALNKRKKRKRKHYERAKKRGQYLYGIGKGYRLSNREDVRGKRRYGHRRLTVSQKHRQSKKAVENRKKTKGYYCYLKMCYLNSTFVNECYKADDMTLLMEHIFRSYQDIDSVIDDYHWGYRDILTAKLNYLTHFISDLDRNSFFVRHYDEILVDSLLDLVSNRSRFIKQSGFSFFTYVVNILAYNMSTQFFRRFNGPQLDVIDPDECASTDDVESYSPLSAFIVLKSKTIQ